MSAIFITPRTFWLWLIATLMVVGTLAGTVAYQNRVIQEQRATIDLIWRVMHP